MKNLSPFKNGSRVICNQAGDRDDLTEGEQYEVIRTKMFGVRQLVWLRDANGAAFADRFSPAPEPAAQVDERAAKAAKYPPVVPPEYQRGDSIEKRFERFHERNPHVYDRLCDMALAVLKAGKDRYGIAALYETLRYTALVTSGESYKLNNNFRALYARKLMAENAELAGFFWTRERSAD